MLNVRERGVISRAGCAWRGEHTTTYYYYYYYHAHVHVHVHVPCPMFHVHVLVLTRGAPARRARVAP